MCGYDLINRSLKMVTSRNYVNWDPEHLELYTMESGEELMLLSSASRKAVLLEDHLNKRNL
jgi:hypothetical protein